jgi:CHAD domain-containing protein
MSAAAFLSPRLQGLARKLREALARVDEGGDEEAIHDLRVVLRRLRSLLKPARVVYGKFHTEAVRAALKSVADASGALRDEEVLLQTLGALEIPVPLRRARGAWLKQRKAREHELRQRFLALLASGEATRAAALLDALLLLPVDPSIDRDLAPFAVRVVEKATRRVLARSLVDVADSEGLHQLRILYKRLRYAAEGLADALPPELAGRAQIAERFQKILGEIHDIDVALLALPQDLSLKPALRDALQAALVLQRQRQVQKFLTAREGREASSSPAPPRPAASPPPPSSRKQMVSSRKRAKTRAGRTLRKG